MRSLMTHSAKTIEFAGLTIVITDGNGSVWEFHIADIISVSSVSYRFTIELAGAMMDHRFLIGGK